MLASGWGKRSVGLSKPIYVGLATGKAFRLIIAVVLLVLAGRTFNAAGQTLTTLWNFTFVNGFYGTNGVNPYAPLVQGSDGNFYGTALAGGANDLGCVFQISPTGNLTNLHSFNAHVHEGIHPSTGLVQGRDRSFYGTTEGGGTSNNGTVFRISPVGSFTNLYSFNHPPPTDLTPVPGWHWAATAISMGRLITVGQAPIAAADAAACFGLRQVAT